MQNYKLYLMLLFSSLLFSCSDKYGATGRWVYINETEHYITYDGDYNSKFNIQPNDTIVYNEGYESTERIAEKEDYVPPLRPSVVIYDNLKCDTFVYGDPERVDRYQDGPGDLNNYEAKRIDKQTIEFTYRFTVEDYENAKWCSNKNKKK